MTDRLKALSDAGVSIWLDDLSRERLDSGNLKQLIAEDSVVGVTTNPTIFAAALAEGNAYDAQTKELKQAGKQLEDVITTLTTDDVRRACDLFTSIHEKTGGYDGRVSIEVEPGLAHDADQTTSRAAELSEIVDRPNVLVKIPATKEGLPAITKTIAAGISVNVTLIFSVDRYREVIDAYLTGLEQAKQAGKDLSKIHSVASFFVSRVDTEVDKRLDAADSPKAKELKGKAAVANARLAYQLFEESLRDERWARLEQAGANKQRPLWASTGVKNPDYPDTLYVAELVTRDVVNTMPEKTLEACKDHLEVSGDTVQDRYADAHAVVTDLKAAGIDLDDVYQVLEDEGVDKFVKSWQELVETVKKALASA